MRTNLLIMCKLLFLLLLINGYFGYISDPFLPFISDLDSFRNYPGFFEWSVKVLFLTSGIGLLFNIKVRTAAILLGVSVILSLLASKPVFRNHLFICGCAFLLSGLSRKDQEPWLLYLQLSLVYFGAVLNKVVQPDWWNGEFMHNWLLNARSNAFYSTIGDLLPDRWLARALSWGSMFTEASIGIMLLFKKRHRAAVWTILLFHTTLYTITGFRFGHFFEDLLIYLLVFLSWPEGKIEVAWNPERTFLSPKLLSLINWNSQFVFSKKVRDTPYWLSLRYSGQTKYGYRAFGYLLLYTPATYFILLFFDSAIRMFFGPFGEHLITSAWLWSGILYFSWIHLKLKSASHKDSSGEKAITPNITPE